MNKRGVTPLVATLMLISFSIGLGAIVMSWGQHYIEEKAEFITAAQVMPLGCDPVSVSLITLAGARQICLAPLTRTIKAFIENGPDATIDNLKARVVGSDGIDEIEPVLQSTLARAGSGTATFLYKQVGSVKQVKMIPYVTVEGKKQYCDKRSIVVEEPFAQCAQ